MKTCPRCQLRYPSNATTCFVDGEELKPMQDPRVGLVLSGRYEIESVVAEGGMAVVYRARQRLVNRECAVKILSSSLVRNKVVRERFRREAKSTQKVAHPNIIEILDHGETEDGLPYLVMEFLEGETLADAIERGKMSLGEALAIGVHIARALARAHDFDVIHRDLKPENVFLCRQNSGGPLAKLLDFGIARSLHDSRITAKGEVFGTPQYLAPDRITSIDSGPSADLYSLGVMLFEMLTGQLPFDADDVATFFDKHLNHAPPRLADRGIEAPARLEALIASLMEKVAGKRPVDAHAVCRELVAISREAGVPVPPEPQAYDEKTDELPKSLPPVSIDRWAKRTLIFEQMLSRAHAGTQPSEAREILTTIQARVREITVLRTGAAKEQRKLSMLEAKSREGRQRFGRAVEGLGLDASTAREEVRAATKAVEAAAATARKKRQRVIDLHPEVISWEGRSAFEEPYKQLAQAYRDMANAIDEWFAEKQQEVAAAEKVKLLESVVTDLEYQIGELRSGLSRLEKSAEEERGAIEQRSTELGTNADRMEQEILGLATKFCEPMRKNPALASLFRQLEDSGT